MTKVILWLATSYLIGSIPFGLLVSHGLFHTDLRKLGSGNIGATNVLRNFGFQPFLAVLLLDLGKGATAVAGARILGLEQLFVLLAGLLAICGHNWSIYLGFKGGKGIATSAGVLIAAFPYQVVVAVILAFLSVVLISRYMSLGSITGALVFPAASFIYFRGELNIYWPHLTFAALTAAFALYKHRDNIKRLWRGEEPKVAIRRERRR
jgi:glycerol-3-phosphate acyltransferase PlsY